MDAASMNGYRIADEPAPSTFARLAVNPIFPLLAVMLGGVWIAWPWLAFNSIAVGSPTRRSEITTLGLGAALVVVLAVGLVFGVGAELVPSGAVRYAALVIVVAKLAITYTVYVMQSRTIEIYEYYGGVLNNGVWILAAAFFLRSRVIGDGTPALLALVLS